MNFRYFFNLFASILLASLLMHVGVAEEFVESPDALDIEVAEELDFVNGRFFDVVGTDHRSVYFVETLGNHIVEQCVSYLKAGSHAFPQSIFVALRPEEYVDFEGDYRIHVGIRGQVSLDFRWNASLSLETLCRGVTEAYLIRYANFNYGPNGPDLMRYWAVSALCSQSYLSLRPAEQVDYIHEAREAGLLKISTLLSVDWKAAIEHQLSPRQGYWFLSTLRQQGLERSAIGKFMDQAIAGLDVQDSVEAFIRPTDAEGEVITLDAWWQTQMIDYLSQTFDRFESMDVSRAWIAEFANFDAYRASGGELADLSGLWTHRTDEALRTVINARREIIALRLDRVNPAYFNAAQSLGALYETTLRSDRRFEFIHAFTAYLSDWEDSKRLQDKVQALLDAGQ
jgi:hypothetical protein